LVLDVVRAADPAQVQAAQEKLKANRAAFRASSLAEAGAGFGTVLDQTNSPSFDAGVSRTSRAQVDPADVPKAYREYEGVFLQNFVKSMMPAESEEVYGKGLAGDMWKSMSAEQIGNVIAQGGGVGIAEQLFAQAVQRQQNRERHAAENDSDRQAVLSLVTDLERRTFGMSVDENEKSSRA
jgi:hypothetical protein